MIKVFKAKCIKDLLYEKTDFIKDSLYYAYVLDTRIIVINGVSRRQFCDVAKCMLKHGHPHGFQYYFEVMEEFHVRNKKELRTII